MREQVEWYWNGAQDGPQRRDVIIYREDRVWTVEQRSGDGASTAVTAIDSDDARTICLQFRTAADSWHEMTGSPQRV